MCKHDHMCRIVDIPPNKKCKSCNKSIMQQNIITKNEFPANRCSLCQICKQVYLCHRCARFRVFYIDQTLQVDNHPAIITSLDPFKIADENGKELLNYKIVAPRVEAISPYTTDVSTLQASSPYSPASEWSSNDFDRTYVVKWNFSEKFCVIFRNILQKRYWWYHWLRNKDFY